MKPSLPARTGTPSGPPLSAKRECAYRNWRGRISPTRGNGKVGHSRWLRRLDGGAYYRELCAARPARRDVGADRLQCRCRQAGRDSAQPPCLETPLAGTDASAGLLTSGAARRADHDESATGGRLRSRRRGVVLAGLPTVRSGPRSHYQGEGAARGSAGHDRRADHHGGAGAADGVDLPDSPARDHPGAANVPQDPRHCLPDLRRHHLGAARATAHARDRTGQSAATAGHRYHRRAGIRRGRRPARSTERRSGHHCSTLAGRSATRRGARPRWTPTWHACRGARRPLRATPRQCQAE